MTKIMNKYVRRMEILSPYGNRRFIGSCSMIQSMAVVARLSTHIFLSCHWTESCRYWI